MSIFGEGVFSHSTSRRFRYDQYYDGMVCSECDDEVSEALKEFDEDSEEELNDYDD